MFEDREVDTSAIVGASERDKETNIADTHTYMYTHTLTCTHRHSHRKHVYHNRFCLLGPIHLFHQNKSQLAQQTHKAIENKNNNKATHAMFAESSNPSPSHTTLIRSLSPSPARSVSRLHESEQLFLVHSASSKCKVILPEGLTCFEG